MNNKRMLSLQLLLNETSRCFEWRQERDHRQQQVSDRQKLMKSLVVVSLSRNENVFNK